MLLCEAFPDVKTLHMHFPDLYSRPSAAVVGGTPLTSPFEVRPGQEPINTEESHVSENAVSGGRHSQLLRSILAHPHLCSTRLKICSNWVRACRDCRNVISWEELHTEEHFLFTLFFFWPSRKELFTFVLLFWQRPILMTKNRHECFEANPPTRLLEVKWP